MKKFFSILLATAIFIGVGLSIAVVASASAPSLTFSSPRYFANYGYGTDLEAIGGVAPYRFELAENNLGLTVNPSTGDVFSGESAKKYGKVIATVYDSNNDSATCRIYLLSPFMSNVMYAFAWLIGPLLGFWDLITGQLRV